MTLPINTDQSDTVVTCNTLTKRDHDATSPVDGPLGQGWDHSSLSPKQLQQLLLKGEQGKDERHQQPQPIESLNGGVTEAITRTTDTIDGARGTNDGSTDGDGNIKDDGRRRSLGCPDHIDGEKDSDGDGDADGTVDVFASLPPTASSSSSSPNAMHVRRPHEENARRVTLNRFEGSEYGKAILHYKRNKLPKFEMNELIRGRRLGKGSFSNVDEIRGILIANKNGIVTSTPSSRNGRLPPIATTSTGAAVAATDAIRKIPRPFPSALRRDDTVAVDDIESRQFIAQHCVRHSGDARYAIKMVRKDSQPPPPSILRDRHHRPHRHPSSDDDNDDDNVESAELVTTEGRKKLILGICDLAVETAFLSSLQHPNIIKLRAVANVDPFSDQYFLVLDRLRETLQKRIEGTWQIRESRLYSPCSRFCHDRLGRRRLEFFEHRLERAFDLGSAIDYLHQKRIIHRDIKPDNIGFDLRDDIKLFDFGMARELRPEFKLEDDTYRLSRCGSPRYMAPEVWLGKPYNSSADVYSFGIVLYEMMALHRAYEVCGNVNTQQFAHQVFELDQRPVVTDLRAPQSIREILPFCWTGYPQYRYDMATVNKTLRKELVLLRKGDESTLPDFARRRSTFVYSNRTTQGESSAKSLDESIQSILTPNSRRRRLMIRSSQEDVNLSLSFHSKGSGTGTK